MIWMVYSGKYHENMDDDWEILVGGFNPTPLKNDGVRQPWIKDEGTTSIRSLSGGWWLTYPSDKYEFVSWDDDIPN